MTDSVRWWVLGPAIVGLFVLVPIFVWSWRGKTYEARWWARSRYRGEITAMMMMPMFVVACVSFIVMELDLADTWIGWGALIIEGGSMVLMFIAMLGGLIWHPLYRLFAPPWWANWSKKEQEEVESGALLRRSAALSRPAWLGQVWFSGEARLWPDGYCPSLKDAHGGLFEIGSGGMWFFQANPDFSGKSVFAARWEDLKLAKNCAPSTVMPWQNAKRRFALWGIGVTPRLVFRTHERTVLASFPDFGWLYVRSLMEKMKRGNGEI